MNDTNGAPINIDQELYPALFQCFFIIGAGYVAGQLGLLKNTHSIGLSRYLSNFALPAVVFKNLVDVQFQSVSWQFLGSVFIAKSLIFLCTIMLTGIGEHPRNFARMGLYAMMTSQSNDFALILPIIDAVYKQTHPDYGKYIYLIAPISLVILNPIGFLLIEIQKRIDDQKTSSQISPLNRCGLIKKISYNIIRNPIVICTLLGVLFNRIFDQHLPNLLERLLTPIAQSFSATALFYLGLTMVGKLSRLHTHLVITVVLLSLMKLILFPLILRQAVFLLLKSPNGTLNNTIDYSNFGFLYGTAPTAPSIIFYVPETDLALQAIISTGLIFSTLLAGPIMLVSAKMINLRNLGTNLTQLYEKNLDKTAYDVSLISLFCTIIVLIGFCLRYRSLRLSFIHKYTFIFVGLQMIHAIWTIGTHFIQLPITPTAAIFANVGGVLTALTTRTWATSISIALMISICYSTERARDYSWVYHLYGWLVPSFATLVIYLQSTFNRREEPVLGVEKSHTVQLTASLILLGLCITISSTNLLRIARRTYRMKHNVQESRRASFTSNEIRPLILNDDDDDESTERSTNTYSTMTNSGGTSEEDTQSIRHAVLVSLMVVNAFICVSVLLWSIAVKNRDGIYYELQFLDTVLLHGQGIITFLIFALDADLLLPISRKVIKILNGCGFKIQCSRDSNDLRCSHRVRTINFEHRIRPDFIRHSTSTQSLTNSMETVFNENDFCQWLVSEGHLANESKAQDYCQDLVTRKQIVCVDRIRDGQSVHSNNHWYAFTK